MIILLNRPNLKVLFKKIGIPIFRVCLVLFPLFFGLKMVAQNNPEEHKELRALYIEKDFEITGNLSNPIWQKAEVAYIAYELSPNDAAAAPVKTEVRVLYSNNFVYFGFRAHDPNPSEIRASISERDHIFGDDYIGVFLDTYGNRQQAYEFFVNPLGIQSDAFRTPSNEDTSFEALWFSKASLASFGYTAVIKIPFKSLNFPKKEIQDWTVQFFRNYPRSARHQLAWTNVDRGDACLLCNNGNLTNIRGIKSENTIEFLPYVAAFQSSNLNEDGNPPGKLNHGPVEISVGGSISYAPTSTTSISAVINPDFSQVESDAAQISVNESFALFYPEKRPFFLKGASAFETGSQLFYSRTINNPLVAGKFIRKKSNFSLAFLTAYDENTPFIIPGLDESSVESSSIKSYSNILRGKYNFGPESYIGALVTTRNMSGGANYVGSLDWKFRLSNKYYLGGQVGYSHTNELEDLDLFNNTRNFGDTKYNAAFNGEQYHGWLMRTDFSRRARTYSFSLGYESFSPTFQTQNGFINQINRRSFNLQQDLSYFPNWEWLANGNLNSFAILEYDYSGQLEERFVGLGTTNVFPGQTQLDIFYFLVNDERFRNEFFTGVRRMSIELSTQPLEEITLGGKVEFGRFIYRTANPLVGKGYNFTAQAAIQPFNQLQLELSYDYSKLGALEGSNEFFSGNIFRMTGRFHFNKELFFRLITQYNSFDEQIQVYPLVYYQLNPFTKFYIGMTDYLQKDVLNQGINTFGEVNRQFFVKLQYLFRY